MDYMRKKIKTIENNNAISPVAILVAIVFAVSFFFFYKENPRPKETEAATIVQDPTFGWYLYQTKTNSLFQVKYPYGWHATYGGGFIDEENLYVESPDKKTVIKVMARQIEKYIDIESLLKDIDTTNTKNNSFYLIKQENTILDGNKAIRREEYIASEKITSIITYVLKDKSIVQLRIDFIGSESLNAEQRSFYSLIADTLKFQ